MEKVVVVLSGGNSATLLYHLVHLGHEVRAIRSTTASAMQGNFGQRRS